MQRNALFLLWLFPPFILTGQQNTPHDWENETEARVSGKNFEVIFHKKVGTITHLSYFNTVEITVEV